MLFGLYNFIKVAVDDMLAIWYVESMPILWFFFYLCSRAGFRNGQAGQLPRGLYNQGASIYFLVY